MILLNDTGVKKMTSNFSVLPSESYIIDLSALSANITVSLMAKSSLEIGDYFEIHTLNSGSYNITLDFITAIEPFEGTSVNKTITASTSYRFIYVGGTFGWKSIELNGGGKTTQLDTTKPCALGSQYIWNGILIECITQTPANTTFSWANFKPILGGNYTWKGVFSATTYSPNDVIVPNTTSTTLYACNTPIVTGSTDYEPISGIKRGYFSPTNLGVLGAYVPSTDTQQGQQGLLPSSVIGSNNFIVRNGGGWQSLLASGGTYSTVDVFNQSVTTIPWNNSTISVDLSSMTSNAYMNLSSAKLSTVGSMVYLQKIDNTAYTYTIYPNVNDMINNGLVSEIQLSSKGDYVLLIVDAEHSIKILSKSATGLTVPTIQSLTDSGNVTNWASIVKCDASALSYNLVTTLPSASSFSGRSISIQKMDNSNNAIIIKPNGTEKINGSTDPIYLYNKLDIISVYSDGSGSYIYNDCRQGTGSSKNYLSINATTTQNISAINTVVTFNSSTIKSNGSSITFDSGTNKFTLKAGNTYKLEANAGYWNGTYLIYQWKDETNNTIIGTGGGIEAVTVDIANATITPTTDIIVSFQITGYNAIGIIGSSAGNRYASAYIECLNTPSTVVNTVDYISAYQSTTQSLSGSNVVLKIDTKTEGNMNLNSDFTTTLKAGKTYLLTGGVGLSYSTDIDLCFRDITNGKDVQNNQQHLGTVQNGSISVHYTPSSDVKIALIAKYISTAGTEGFVDVANKRVMNAWFTINQIGSTGVSNVPFNLLGGITDSASSGYFDIGTMRIQWGTNTSTVSGEVSTSFLVPFASSSYTVTTTPIHVSTISVNGIITRSKSPTSFTCYRCYESGSTAGVSNLPFDWIAIGLKP